MLGLIGKVSEVSSVFCRV